MMALMLVLLASPGDLGSQVKARLGDARVLRGTFEQSKQIKGFKRPLKSAGIYIVTRGEGVQWNTLKPFPSELTVAAAEIVSKQGGAQVFRLEASSEPTVRLITQLLFALLAGDLPALESQFVASGEVGDETWSIELTPKSEALRASLASIQLKGDRAVRWVQLREPTGDITSISLSPEAPPHPVP